MQGLIGTFKWLIEVSIPPALVLTLLGYMFREKWKQILTKSLSVDLEKLKHELAIAQAAHAASLTPQLESIKHDFQQKLEAYKVSLIAQAEEVKIRGDVRKTIATQYVETRFERLIALEKALSSSLNFYQASVTFAQGSQYEDAHKHGIVILNQLGAHGAECEMFLNRNDTREMYELFRTCAKMLTFIGPEKVPLSSDSDEWKKFIGEKERFELKIRGMIHEMASL